VENATNDYDVDDGGGWRLAVASVLAGEGQRGNMERTASALTPRRKKVGADGGFSLDFRCCRGFITHEGACPTDAQYGTLALANEWGGRVGHAPCVLSNSFA